MKKLLFAIPILAIAVLFTYCDRPTVAEEFSELSGIAQDRGKCQIRIDKASATDLIVCGTNTNATVCATCGPNPTAVGQVVIPGVSPFFLNLTTPITLYFSTATMNTFTITTATNTYGPITVGNGAGGCVTVNIGDDCTATP